jgi:hypothetical protein
MTSNRLLTIVTALCVLSCSLLINLYLNEKALRVKLEQELLSTSNIQLSTARTNTAEAQPEPLPIDQALPTNAHLEAQIISPPTPTPIPQATLSELAIYGIESRVSALGKVVGLNDEQRERLRSKYQAEAVAKRKGVRVETESLDQIIGEENNKFYQEQLNSAFEKSRSQELDREVYYTSRKLQLTSQQEESYRQLLATVEDKVKERFGEQRASAQFQNDPSFRVRITIQENDFRSEWLNQQLKQTLAQDQYQAYVQEQADSSAAELGVWHAP